MTHSIKEFETDWSNENAATLKVLQALTDNSLQQKVTLEGRSLGFLAWHIVLTLGEMAGKSGLHIDAPKESVPVPSNASAIVAAYEKAALSLLNEVVKNWSDARLDEEIEMYGEKWKCGVLLDSLIRHEIHHRAQMTVLMRQAGLRVPGVYCPSREEWAQMGMSPMQ